MVTDREIQNQKVLVEDLQNQMPIWENPDMLIAPGYIPTSQYTNRTGPGNWTDGIEYRFLDEDTIAWRVGGDYRDNGDWKIADLEDFRQIVIDDAIATLGSWQEQ